MVTRAGIKDVRAYHNGPAYESNLQEDELQFAQERARMATPGVMVPLADAENAASKSFANQARVQVDYVPYIFDGQIAPGASFLLIPRNVNRSGLFITNRSQLLQAIFITFGPPPYVGAGFRLNPNAGLASTFQQSNGAISIDDVYITPGAPVSFVVTGYEGIPALGLAA